MDGQWLTTELTVFGSQAAQNLTWCPRAIGISSSSSDQWQPQPLHLVEFFPLYQGFFFQVFKACLFKKQVKSHFARRLWPCHVSVISYLRISCNVFWCCSLFSHFLPYPPASPSPYTFVPLLVLNSSNIIDVVYILVGVWLSLESGLLTGATLLQNTDSPSLSCYQQPVPP